jgi:hypothetical protein
MLLFEHASGVGMAEPSETTSAEVALFLPQMRHWKPGSQPRGCGLLVASMAVDGSLYPARFSTRAVSASLSGSPASKINKNADRRAMREVCHDKHHV